MQIKDLEPGQEFILTRTGQRFAYVGHHSSYNRKWHVAYANATYTTLNYQCEVSLPEPSTKDMHPNAWTPWDDTEEAALRYFFNRGMKLPDLSKHFGRTPGAIVARLRKLGLLVYIAEGRFYARASDLGSGQIPWCTWDDTEKALSAKDEKQELEDEKNRAAAKMLDNIGRTSTPISYHYTCPTCENKTRNLVGTDPVCFVCGPKNEITDEEFAKYYRTSFPYSHRRICRDILNARKPHITKSWFINHYADGWSSTAVSLRQFADSVERNDHGPRTHIMRTDVYSDGTITTTKEEA